MRIIAFSPFKHLEYARQALQVPLSSSTGGLVALDDEDKPQGIVLLDNWTKTAVMGHIAIQHPMAMRKLPFEAMDYVFNRCGKRMFIGVIPSDNVKSMKFHKHLGFSEIFRIPDGYAEGVDYVMVQMLREDCKYINRIKEVA